MPKVSILIPSKDRLDLLQQCVASVRQHCKGDYEIIVAVTGSGDEFVWAGANDCRVIGMPKATYAEAINRMAEIARGEYLLLLNNDVILQGDPFTIQEPDTIRGYRLLYPNGLIQHAGVGLDMDGNPYHVWHRAPGEHFEVINSRYVLAVTFACVLIPRQAWEVIGRLDEAYHNAYEDLDFCLRAKESGYNVSYMPFPSAIHLTGQTAGRQDHVTESWAYFKAKWIDSGRLSGVTGVYPFSVQQGVA